MLIGREGIFIGYNKNTTAYYRVYVLGLEVNALINAIEATIYKKVQLPFKSRAYTSLI